MKIGKNFKKFVTGLTIAISLAYGSYALGQSSTELMSGKNGVTLDTKFSTELTSKTNLFLRNRIGVDYNNDIRYFGLADLSKKIAGNVDAVAEVQFIPEVGVVPRIGLQYFKKFGDFKFYGLGSASLNKDAEFLVNLRYNPSINSDLKGVVNLENITNVGPEGHNFSTQRIRLGLEKNKYELGFAIDLVENSKEISCNPGFYGKVNF